MIFHCVYEEKPRKDAHELLHRYPSLSELRLAPVVTALQMAEVPWTNPQRVTHFLTSRNTREDLLLNWHFKRPLLFKFDSQFKDL